LKSNADLKAVDIKLLPNATSFSVIYKGKKLGLVKIKIPGMHNILNALGAIATGLFLDIPFKIISQAVFSFDGVGRRLEIKGNKNGITVIDDYGHHPTEVEATIKAIKHFWAKRNLIVLFQPHRYTRTQNLFKDFGKSFSSANKVFLLDIYPAGEKPIKGVSADLILKELQKNKVDAQKFSDIKSISKMISSGDIVLTLGAGDVFKQGETLLTLI
jgi:UDP-N-acetylmuramate--alanine ligase